jgi:hypothetical protein
VLEAVEHPLEQSLGRDPMAAPGPQSRRKFRLEVRHLDLPALDSDHGIPSGELLAGLTEPLPHHLAEVIQVHIVGVRPGRHGGLHRRGEDTTPVHDQGLRSPICREAHESRS